MTENENIQATFEDAIYCAKSWAGDEFCEECRLYPLCHTFCDDVAEIIVKALEEIQQYRAIGTVEEFKALKEEVELYRNLDKTNFSDGYNRAIDEFADELINHSVYADIGKGNVVKMEWVSPVTRIEKVREQMKGGV